MATITQLVDDITGETKDVQNVKLSFDGTDYEIDLAAASRKTLTDRLQPFIDAARPIPSTTAKPAKRKRGTEDITAIRAWAASNGYQIAERGRISGEVRKAYEEAQRGA